VSEDRLQLLERRTDALTERVAWLEWAARAPASAAAPQPAPGAAVTAPPASVGTTAPGTWHVPSGAAAGTQQSSPGMAQQPGPGMAPRPSAPALDTPPAPPPGFLPPVASGSAPPTWASSSRKARQPIDIEDLLGGRVLAWVGGLAVLIGVAFLFAIAISRGWIGEGARTAMAGAGSLALLAVGVWLREQRGRGEAALAAVGTAVAALFMTVTVAAQVYELVPASIGLLLAAAIGAAATGLAVRWSAPAVGALGIVGCLLSPVLVDAPSTAGTLAFLFVAGASAAGVLVWRRWNWLALIAFVITTPQWLAWIFDADSTSGVLAVLVLFGTLNAASAIGFELRVPSTRLRVSSSFLLVAGALVLALAGWFSLVELDHRHLAEGWLAALAGAHLAIGLAARRVERISHEIGLLALVLSVVLFDVAFALVVDGPGLAMGWAAGGLGFAVLLRRASRTADEALVGLGLGGHLALSMVSTLAGDAPPSALGDAPADLAAAVMVLAALAASCFTSARIAREGHAAWGMALDALGLVVVAYLTAIAFDGPALAVAWALEAALLATLARRAKDELAAVGAAAFLFGAGAHALAFEAPPNALVDGLTDPFGALLAVGAVAAAALRCAQLRLGDDERSRPVFGAIGAVALLYLASTALVTPFQPDSAASGARVLDLGVREQGQLLLSALWSVVGVTVLVIGLRRDLRALRLGALALLLVTIGKVFLYDLSTLTSIYRVVSFVGLGLLLLGAAYAWQRLRPEPSPDTRETPTT